MPKKQATKQTPLESEFVPSEPYAKESVAEYVPAQKTEKAAARSIPRSRTTDAAYRSPGARLTPTYIERTPSMWAVGEVDIKAISDDSLVANVAFAFASFLLGFAMNILVTYAGMEKLTEVGSLMLHKGAVILILLSALFYTVGIVMTCRKNAIWGQIKKESKAAPTNK